ncbi:unnamed protein product [Ixodes persulcatus]
MTFAPLFQFLCFFLFFLFIFYRRCCLLAIVLGRRFGSSLFRRRKRASSEICSDLLAGLCRFAYPNRTSRKKQISFGAMGRESRLLLCAEVAVTSVRRRALIGFD